jgi:hypothetical protein
MSKMCQLLLILVLVISCGKTSQEALYDSIEQANNFLTDGNCNDAIDILEDHGVESDNADFMKVYSSAYACRAGFSMLDLFDLDIGNVNSASLLVSLAALSSSDETTADSARFLALQRAIEIITESQLVSSNASASERASFYGDLKGVDLNFQATLMMVVQVGKFFNLYGDADSTGVKGANGNNSCLFSYTHADAVSAINNTTPGSCVSATGTEGSSFLEAPVSTTLIQTRMCYGIVLFNNFIDTLGSLSLSSSQYGDLDQIKSVVDTAYSSAISTEAGAYSSTVVNDVKDIRTQALCEALAFDEVERYYAFFLENLYQ